MTLEEAIKQKQFPNEIEKAFVNVLFTGNFFYNQNMKRFKPFGISPEQYNVLRILRGSDPIKLNILEISNRMLDRNSNATRLVEKLRIRGLVDRNPLETDRRQVEVGITQAGMDMLQALDMDFKKWKETYKGINQEEAKILNQLLDKMRD
jgi:DNA-binding MarR family transcriptional regulator